MQYSEWFVAVGIDEIRVIDWPGTVTTEHHDSDHTIVIQSDIPVNAEYLPGKYCVAITPNESKMSTANPTLTVLLPPNSATSVITVPASG